MGFPHDLLREIYNDESAQKHIKRMIRRNLESVEVDYKGCRMHVHPSDNNTEFQIWRMGRTHEERAIRNILSEIAGKPFIAFDVGANAGSFSLRLGAVAPEGSQVHAFEPNPRMRKRLEHNLGLNGLDNVQVHDCAISDEFGRMELFLPDKSNLGQARLGSPFENGEKISVDVCPLTHFLPKDGKAEIDFLKIDIEGFEDRALMPLLTEVPFEYCPKLIFFEHKHNTMWQVDIVSELGRFGYQMKKEYGRNALFEKKRA
ncbi:FkbM family methyltransferase [Cognatishimia sp.]|uniref:FkbM family methyltransferase n=1 Tax=Cognatishimia sp. TaxID=2211648 RepID=UPI00351576C2